MGTLDDLYSRLDDILIYEMPSLYKVSQGRMPMWGTATRCPASTSRGAHSPGVNERTTDLASKGRTPGVNESTYTSLSGRGRARVLPLMRPMSLP